MTRGREETGGELQGSLCSKLRRGEGRNEGGPVLPTWGYPLLSVGFLIALV